MPNDVRNPDPESRRLSEDASRELNWKRWGPYLAARQWGTVREDYSRDGDCWNYFPHDHARSRAFRWGEDGLLGVTDRQCRTCFSIALWNGQDPFLKERLFGLTNGQGNHGEDVKEQYFFLESTPTHSYMRALYKYPQAPFPYDQLVAENARRDKTEPEYELVDTGVFDEHRYFDVFVEYAKNGTDDLLIRVTAHNRGDRAAPLWILPQAWFRNVWSWGCSEEGCEVRPRLRALDERTMRLDEPSLGPMTLSIDEVEGAESVDALFTENETNVARLFGAANPQPFVKDAFHEYVVSGRRDAVNPARVGSKGAWAVKFTIEPGGSRTLRLRLAPKPPAGTAAAPASRPAASTGASSGSASGSASGAAFGAEFERIFAARKSEHDVFYADRVPANVSEAEALISRQAYAGLLWSKQFYHYSVDAWLTGDPDQPAPPAERKEGRNRDWRHLYNRDVLSMPDTWEYPWFAAWDLAFHMIPMARIDPQFAKDQLLLLLREWYMHPNGQIPAYEFNFGDVNPPVHAWACWRVYKMTGPRGGRDRLFLARAFQKLLINFTWWVNRKDPFGNHLFAGGFLGLDNIGVFDRNRPLPGGGQLVQADGTAWMAFYCSTMLAMAVELAKGDPAYEDVASKFFEHFVAICDAMNHLGGNGLWDDEDGFYYDQMILDGKPLPLRVRSMVGLIPLFAAEVVTYEELDGLPNLRKRIDWFLANRRDLGATISYLDFDRQSGRGLLAIPSRERLRRVLRRVLDENEFLSDNGLRSLSKVHEKRPYRLRIAGEEFVAEYEPAETRHRIFGGNSNWRGPVWFPLNYLLIESLQRYHYAYGDEFTVECPVGSGKTMNLHQVAEHLQARMIGLFTHRGEAGRPCHGGCPRFAGDPHWKDLVLFHEYFHGDDGRGLGASHQTGWTSLVATMIESLARAHSKSQNAPATAASARAPSDPRLQKAPRRS